MTWVVEVVDINSGEVVKTIPCGSERRADRVLRGLLINMDMNRFFAREVNRAEQQEGEK